MNKEQDKKKAPKPMQADMDLDLPLDCSDLEPDKPEWLGGTETEEKFWSHTD